MSSIVAWTYKNRVTSAYILGSIVTGCFLVLACLGEAEDQVNAKAKKAAK